MVFIFWALMFRCPIRIVYQWNSLRFCLPSICNHLPLLLPLKKTTSYFTQKYFIICLNVIMPLIRHPSSFNLTFHLKPLLPVRLYDKWIVLNRGNRYISSNANLSPRNVPLIRSTDIKANQYSGHAKHALRGNFKCRKL